MSTYLGKTLLSGVATNTISNAHSLLDFKWTDHILNEMSWLRADTFSWHNGDVYVGAYNHLVNDLSNSLKKKWYAWNDNFINPTILYSESASPSLYDKLYTYVDGQMLQINEVNGLHLPEYIIDDNSSTNFYRDSASDLELLQPQTETIGSYSITYYPATDGHKICLPDQETTVQNIYNESGVAWYYILDTTNKRFKLPRINPTREELIEEATVIGNGKNLRLIGYNQTSEHVLQTKSYDSTAASWSIQLAGSTSSDPGQYVGLGFTLNPDHSGIITTFSSVSSVYKGKKYLYFYVGDYDTADLANIEIYNNKANIDMDNLTDTGKNIANWSNNVTNCITEIPQDIKVELYNGGLKVLSGTKLYFPNGFEQDGVTPKFDVKTLSSDISRTFNGSSRNITLWFPSALDLIGYNTDITECFSGASAPSGYTYMLWYDTTNNIMKHTNDGGSTWDTSFSLPICVCKQESNSSISDVIQVFNGFGYIGSTVFALPGVKGLIPDGRNAEGTLKSTEFTTNSVLVTTFPNTYTASAVIAVNDEIYSALRSSFYTYDLEKNYNLQQGVKIDWAVGGLLSTTNGKITSFNPKTVFHALDWNDKGNISGFSMPSGNYIALTLGASGTTYTAPANGWFEFGSGASGVIQLVNQTKDIGITSPTQSYGARTFVPTKKGDVVICTYTATPSTYKFIYAEGEV